MWKHIKTPYCSLRFAIVSVGEECITDQVNPAKNMKNCKKEIHMLNHVVCCETVGEKSMSTSWACENTMVHVVWWHVILHHVMIPNPIFNTCKSTCPSISVENMQLMVRVDRMNSKARLLKVLCHDCWILAHQPFWWVSFSVIVFSWIVKLERNLWRRDIKRWKRFMICDRYHSVNISCAVPNYHLWSNTLLYKSIRNL